MNLLICKNKKLNIILLIFYYEFSIIKNMENNDKISDQTNVVRILCMICKCAIPSDNYEEHVKSCLTPESFLLSDYQKCAIKYCKNKSE
jgi:hypothetical protein